MYNPVYPVATLTGLLHVLLHALHLAALEPAEHLDLPAPLLLVSGPGLDVLHADLGPLLGVLLVPLQGAAVLRLGAALEAVVPITAELELDNFKVACQQQSAHSVWQTRVRTNPLVS